MSGAELNAWLTAPEMLIGGGFAAALLVALLILSRRRGETVLPLIGLLVIGAAVFFLVQRAGLLERDAAKRALIERAAALDRAALAPGSPLSCINADAGEAVENGCERAIFASPQSAAAGVAYMGARLRLLADAAAFNDAEIKAALSASRRTIELDRYGLAAQALGAREGCTAERCAAFALVSDASALKANLKARVFEQYASRYADAWNAQSEKQPVLSALPPVTQAEPPKEPHPLSSKYDFPSAASIPPVSIMNPEPKLPAGNDASSGETKAAAAPEAQPPIPPKRPVEAAPAR